MLDKHLRDHDDVNFADKLMENQEDFKAFLKENGYTDQEDKELKKAKWFKNKYECNSWGTEVGGMLKRCKGIMVQHNMGVYVASYDEWGMSKQKPRCEITLVAEAPEGEE